MQEKQFSPHALKLKKEVDNLHASKQRQVILNLIVVLITFASGEVLDLPSSRLLSLLLILSVYYLYDQKNTKEKVAKDNLTFFRTDETVLKEAEYGNVAFIDKLVALRSRAIWAKDPETGKNPLHHAVIAGSLDTISYLLNKNDELSRNRLTPEIINQQDAAGDTPLHEAVQSILMGHRRDFKVLLALILRPKVGESCQVLNDKINPLLTNSNGETVLSLLQVNMKQIKGLAKISEDTEFLQDYNKVVGMLFAVTEKYLERQQSAEWSNAFRMG